MRRLCWIVLLAAGLTGCPCTTEEITVTYAITDAEAKEGCDDFCGRAVLRKWVDSREVVACEEGVTDDGAKAFVCTFSETVCAPAPDSHM